MKYCIITLVLVFIISCEQKKINLEPLYGNSPIPTKMVLRFGIHPLHNPVRLISVFGPMIDYLNKNIPEVTFQLEGSVNYAAFEDKIKKRLLDFALPNPYQTLLSLKYGYRVFAKMGDDQNFYGIILIRKDSGIKSIAQLRGKTISYPAPTALAATMMPQYFLFKHGLNVFKETKSLYVGSQESSIMNVFLKNSQAASTWPMPWKSFMQDNPEKANQLEVKWKTDTLPNNGLVVRDDMSEVLVAKVRRLLLDLNKSEEGKSILLKIGLSQFEQANDQTFNPVNKFITQFSKDLKDLNRDE